MFVAGTAGKQLLLLRNGKLHLVNANTNASISGQPLVALTQSHSASTQPSGVVGQLHTLNTQTQVVPAQSQTVTTQPSVTLTQSLTAKPAADHHSNVTEELSVLNSDDTVPSAPCSSSSTYTAHAETNVILDDQFSSIPALQPDIPGDIVQSADM